MTTVSHARTVWTTDLGLLRTFIALSATADALVHPPSVPDTVEAWPYAQSRFCCPARHHFRATPTSPPFVPPALPVSPNLADDYRHRIVAKAWGSQVRFSVHFPCMLLTLPRGLRRCTCLFLPGAIGLPPSRTGAASSLLAQVYPKIGLSQLQTPDQSSRGCIIRFRTTAYRFGRRPRLGSRHRVGASSAQVLPPERAPSLHTSKGNWYGGLLSSR